MNRQELDQHLASQIESRTPMEGIQAMCDHVEAKRLVWWGCLCAWSIWRPVPTAADDESLRIVTGWVFSDNDDFRILAAHRLNLGTTGSCKWLLSAAINSGGTIRLPGESTDKPTPDVARKLIHGFLHNLLSQSTPIERAQVAQKFVQLARQAIAEPLPTAAMNPQEHPLLA